MMDWLINWGVKRYVVKIVNLALDRYNVNVERARAIVAVYSQRVKALLNFLDSLDAMLADGKLTEDESDLLVEDAKKLGKELAA